MSVGMGSLSAKPLVRPGSLRMEAAIVESALTRRARFQVPTPRPRILGEVDGSPGTSIK